MKTVKNKEIEPPCKSGSAITIENQVIDKYGIVYEHHKILPKAAFGLIRWQSHVDNSDNA